MASREALPSPRNRMGAFGSSFDGVLNSGSKRRLSVNLTGAGGGPPAREDDKDEAPRGSNTKNDDTLTPDPQGDNSIRTDQQPLSRSPDIIPPPGNVPSSAPASDPVVQGVADMSLGEPDNHNLDQRASTANSPVTGPPGFADPASIEWSYLDPQGQEQG